MKKINHVKNTHRHKKLAYFNGHYGGFLSCYQLQQALSISESHAYRLIRDPRKLNKRHRAILDSVLFGQIAGFSKGWQIKNGQIIDPTGHKFSERDLENLKALKEMGLMRAMQEELKKAV